MPEPTMGPRREFAVAACVLDRYGDLRRWSWSVSVNGRLIQRDSAHGYTVTRWGAMNAARRWHRWDEKNRQRTARPSVRKQVKL